MRPSVAAAAGLPVIKRFSGGGTVVVDGDTLLTSLIVQVGGGGGGGGLGGMVGSGCVNADQPLLCRRVAAKGLIGDSP